MSLSAPLNDREQKLIKAIASRHDALLADLKLHVALPTGRENRPALDETRSIFQSRCQALGAQTELIPGQPRPDWIDGPQFFTSSDSGGRTFSPPAPPPTLICRHARAGKKSLLLSGHLDTVHDPASPFNALNIAPDKKTATGPGCVDMKGGLVIAMAALEALAETGFDLPWSVILNSDEETGSLHSAPALDAEAATGNYSAALALEPAHGPTGLPIARAGSGTFMIEARGKAAHVGRDFAQGVSATDALARAILAAHALTDIPTGRTVNVSPLWCDQPTNQVADHAAAWGNVRFTDEASQKALDAALTSLERGSSANFPHVTIRRAWQRPAKPTTPAVQTLANAAQATAAVLGQFLTFTTTGGVCDGNNLQAAGLPTIDTLGVRGGGLHTPQEWIELASLVERCQLLALLMARLSP